MSLTEHLPTTMLALACGVSLGVLALGSGNWLQRYLARWRARKQNAYSVHPVQTVEQQLRRELGHVRCRLGLLTQSLPLGVFEADVAGRCQFMTEYCARILGVNLLDGLVGSWFDYLHPDDRADVAEDWRAAWQQLDPFTCECRVVARDGGQRWVLIQCRPLVTDFATVYVGTIDDVTEQRRSARQLQRFAERLERARDEERDRNRQLEALVEELRKARCEAESGARAKSEFLANMSHEIRTPMTAILGFTDALLEESDSEISADSPLRTIRRNAEYLLDLLNDILDLSKIEAGHLDVESVACSPRQIAADVLDLMQIRVRGRDVALTCDITTDFPHGIASDPTRLKQVMLNLVGNAVKFTQSGTVSLRLSVEPPVRESDEHDAADVAHCMVIQVADTGIGMDEATLARLFKPFTQADASTTRRFGGTGLGLTICREFVERMGGSICVTSEPGQGSTFTISIPLQLIEDCDPTTDAARFDTPACGQTLASPCDDVSLVGARVLLAEDGTDNQKLLEFVLRKVGIELTIVDNGVDAVMTALDAWRTGRPFDAILMDMQMPVLDGYSATRQLRTSGYQGSIIALTAHSMRGDREKCLDAGCNEYTCKPIRRPELLRMLREGVAASQQHRGHEVEVDEPSQQGATGV